MKKSWNSILQNSVDRCGFLTPEPHYIKAVIIEAVQQYQDLVNIYIEDIVSNSIDGCYFDSFYEYILSQDIITEVWWTYGKFQNTVLQTLPYIEKSGERIDEVFLLRIYKDYLMVLNMEELTHPIVKLCKRLRIENTTAYELFMSKLQYLNNPSFVGGESLGVFVSPRYIGEEYININGEVVIDDNTSIFSPVDIRSPKWTDFLRRFMCDLLLDELEKKPGAATLKTFLIENTYFIKGEDCDTNRFDGLNNMYLYLVYRFIEIGHPEYVKILLRNLGKLDWRNYIHNKDEEIIKLKRLYFCCMRENGYEPEYSIRLWREA